MTSYYRKNIFGGPLKHVNACSVKQCMTVNEEVPRILLFVFVSFVKALKLINGLKS